LLLLSVVIATFNRCGILETTLNNLAQQSISHEDFEVLVIDDGSTDGTSEVVKSLIPSLPYSLRYYRHENQGPGYTQNRGIREAHSNIVLLMADDIWATSKLLEEHLKIHKEHPEQTHAVLGKVLQSKKLPESVLLKYWDPFGFDRFRGKHIVESIYFYACNISVKKSFMIENGMFKETKGASHEDVELGYRLGQKGLKIIYNEYALAYHYHFETLSNACKRAYERGLNFNLLSENIEKSYIFPVYNIFSFEAGFKVALKMLPREILRQCLFNKYFVNFFWLPALRRAETNRLASIFARNITYRGTIFHHVREGYKDARKKENRSKTDSV
jgi:glycosyltransferase involved in cell wall biosynthesis